MKHVLPTLAVVGAIMLVAPLKPAAQSVSIQAEMLKDWASLKDTMNKIANAMPEEVHLQATPAERTTESR